MCVFIFEFNCIFQSLWCFFVFTSILRRSLFSCHFYKYLNISIYIYNKWCLCTILFFFHSYVICSHVITECIKFVVTSIKIISTYLYKLFVRVRSLTFSIHIQLFIECCLDRFLELNNKSMQDTLYPFDN